VGRALGVLTMTPYDHWRRCHAIHHATSGNLDRRGIGDIKTLTVREYFARNWRDRLRYRLYRHPLVMFGLGPAYVFLLENRLPIGFMRKGSMPWLSTMTTNAGILLASGLLILFVGFTTLLVVHLPIVVLAATMGVWLFYVQHQFETTTWDETTDWRQPEAALHGSSHYDLPPVLRWFSANIGVHHVHHLSSGVPFYRLPDVLRTYPELREVGRLTLWQSLICVRLTLWDEETRRLMSFREARAAHAARRG
jgi:omega-6 fatty acid desaturase (delta-12 desaturase)